MSMKNRLPQGVAPFPDFLISGKARCFPVFHSFRRSAKQGGLLQNPKSSRACCGSGFNRPIFSSSAAFPPSLPATGCTPTSWSGAGLLPFRFYMFVSDSGPRLSCACDFAFMTSSAFADNGEPQRLWVFVSYTEGVALRPLACDAVWSLFFGSVQV